MQFACCGVGHFMVHRLEFSPSREPTLQPLAHKPCRTSYQQTGRRLPSMSSSSTWCRKLSTDPPQIQCSWQDKQMAYDLYLQGHFALHHVLSSSCRQDLHKDQGYRCRYTSGYQELVAVGRVVLHRTDCCMTSSSGSNKLKLTNLMVLHQKTH